VGDLVEWFEEGFGEEGTFLGLGETASDVEFVPGAKEHSAGLICPWRARGAGYLC
jgi:hypothetical protein